MAAAAFETAVLSRKFGPVHEQGASRDTITATAIIAMSTTMLDDVADSVGLFYLPANAVIVGATISAGILDAGLPEEEPEPIAAALAIDIGDADVEDRIFAASAVGKTGTLSAAIAATAHLHKYTTKTQLRAYVETAATGPVAGTLKVSVEYFVDPEFSTTALVAS
jgi:hypothetical protein